MPGPDGLAVAAIVVAADPVGPAGDKKSQLFQFSTFHGAVNDAPLPCKKEESRAKCDKTQTSVDAGCSDLHCFLESTCRQDDVKQHVSIITESPRSSAKIVTKKKKKKNQGK